MYWKSNHHKPNLSFRCFLAKLRKYRSQHPPKFRISSSLILILTRRLAIQIEGNSSPLFCCPHLPFYHSSRPDDASFGAKVGGLEETLANRNSFVFSPEGLTLSVAALVRMIASIKATRVVIISPTDLVQPILSFRWCLELARYEHGFSKSTISDQKTVLSQSLSLILCLNKESLVVDPIDWPLLKEELATWSRSEGVAVSFPEVTDSRFNERTFSYLHQRKAANPPPSHGALHFFDGRVEKSEETKHLSQSGLSSFAAGLINKINKHPPELSALGILPNQLRSLMKLTLNEHDDAMLDLSKTLFWKGYSIWKKRKP